MSKKARKAKTVTMPPIPPVIASAFLPKQPKKVMEIGGVHVYGSSAFLVGRIPDLSLRIDLSGLDLGSTQLVGGNTAAHAQLPHTLFAQKVPVLSIDWADGTAHTLDMTWWETLIGAIDALPDGSSVAVCCVGGTGRTGTVLAILAGLSGQLDDDSDPVQWVRDHYYDDAVETEEQIWYVEDITGLLTSVYPSNHLYQPPMTAPHGTQVLGIPAAPHSQAMVTGPLGGPASVGASDHTGS